MSASGVSVVPIRQSNGHEELAEVAFDDVLVPCSDRIGAEGEGWAIAMDILSYERGTSSWLRQLLLHDRAEELLRVTKPNASQLGDVLLDLHSLRLMAGNALLCEAGGIVAGPAAAPVKLVRTDAEQHLYDLVDASLDGALATGSLDCDRLGHWQDAYLFSRAVSVYGGTRQMQLATVARHLLGVGR
jgi:alkylation response protein AidB-like acyl-CoA dehydrogenase